MVEMFNKHKKSQIIEQKLEVELQSYIDSRPKEKAPQEERINQIDDHKWVNTIDDYKWVNTDEPKNNFSVFSKYSLMVGLFIFGLFSVSVVKNETRNLEKEINTLTALNNTIIFNLEQGILDNEVITSPENISKLAEQHLDDNFIFYKKSQIIELGEDSQTPTTLTKKNDSLRNKIKISVGNEIKKKKTELVKLQKLYYNPKSIPAEIKTEVAKKIEEKKKELKNLYSEPKKNILHNRSYRWAAVQVAKLFLGIPIVPGR
tara:strand:+ start:1907 stop:2686 length:780 start_codon:yes stop_codon:yes gene_type:complete